MSNRQIKITVEGAVRSGKTYLMEKIAKMLSDEGVNVEIVCPDGDFGKFTTAEDVPSLSELMNKLDGPVTLEEKHVSTMINLDPMDSEVYRTRSSFTKLRTFKKPIVLMIVAKEYVFSEAIAKIKSEVELRYPLPVQYLIEDSSELTIGELEEKPLVIILRAQKEAVTARELFSFGNLPRCPAGLPFISRGLLFLESENSCVNVRDRNRPTLAFIDLDEWLAGISFVDLPTVNNLDEEDVKQCQQ